MNLQQKSRNRKENIIIVYACDELFGSRASNTAGDSLLLLKRDFILNSFQAPFFEHHRKPHQISQTVRLQMSFFRKLSKFLPSSNKKCLISKFEPFRMEVSTNN